MFAIDDIHLADSFSWSLLADLQQQQQRPIFVVTIRTRQIGQVHPEEYKTLLTRITTKKICLEGLHTQHLCGLACQLLQVARIPAEIHR